MVFKKTAFCVEGGCANRADTARRETKRPRIPAKNTGIPYITYTRAAEVTLYYVVCEPVFTKTGTSTLLLHNF